MRKVKMDRNKNNVKSEENMISEKNRKSDANELLAENRSEERR